MSTMNLNDHSQTQSNSFINSPPHSHIQLRNASRKEDSDMIPTRCLDRAYWVSLLESSSLNDEDKLLVRLRKIDRLPWKEVQAQFNRERGTEAQQGKLQMRITRMPRKSERAKLRQKAPDITQQPDLVASGCAEGTYNHETLFNDQETWVPTCQAPSHLDQSTWCQLSYTDSYNYQNSVAFSPYCNGLISGYQPPSFDFEDNFQLEQNGHKF